MKTSIIKIFLLVFFISSLLETINAIPAFARKYKMSCQTCHSPVPRLKAIGDDFAGDGFVFRDQEASRYYIDTGDETLSLIRDFPLAVRLDAYITYNNQKTKQSDLSVPYLVKLLSGGSIAEDLAYYFYFYMSERGEVVGVEDAYIMFNNVFGSELDIYVGQFQVSDPLFKRELRLTFEDYHIYKIKPGITKGNLAYDRGIMLTYGFESGTDIILEIVNGTGLGEANIFKNFDDDKYKNFVGRITQDVTDFARVGVFGYYGQEKIENNFGDNSVNKFWVAGPDITLGFDDKLELNLQYLVRKDDALFTDSDALIPLQ
ncbi:MAG: hypothetical protein JW866_10585, partial [Ignavibacteriales bacterium]|nr:hypothetical protein [Ignavibacteriales bacterium]